MRIDLLKIKNFRKFREVEVEIPDGVTGIVGRNGSGKSTLLESIGWALYGHDAARTKKELLKFKGARDDEEVRVEVRFSFGEHTYTVVREISGRSESQVAELSVDGVPLVVRGPNSGQAVTSALTKILHRDRQAFFASAIARQRELNALSDLTPGERKKLVLSLLRIDSIDRAIILVRSDRRVKLQQYVTLSSLLRPDSEFEEKRKELEEQESRIEKEMATAREELPHIEEEISNSKRSLESWERLLKERADLEGRTAERKRRVESHRARAQELEKKIEELERRKEEIARFEDLERERERALRVLEEAREERRRREEKALWDREKVRLEAEHQRVLSTLTALKGKALEIEELEKRAQEVTFSLESARREVEELQVETGRVSTLLDRLEAEGRKERQRFDLLRRLGPESECPTCRRPLKDHFERVFHETEESLKRLLEEAERHRKRRASLEALHREKSENLGRLEKEEKRIRAQIQSTSREVGGLGSLEEQSAFLSGKIRDIEARLASLSPPRVGIPTVEGAEKALKSVEEELRRIQRIREEVAPLPHLEEERRRVLRELEEEERELSLLERSLSTHPYDKGSHDRARRTLEELQRRREEVQVRIARLEGDLSRVRSERERWEREREENRRRERESREAEEELRLLERLAGESGGILLDFKDWLIGRVRPALSHHAGELYRELTDGKYEGIEISEDYDISIVEDGVAYPLERFSGGEEDLANLCLRLAIGEVLAERAGGEEFSFLALDEVFGSQDEVRRNNLLRSLAKLSGKYRQILLITHIEDVREAADRIFRIVERADGSSQIERE